jgi:hypothetical protein
LVHLFCAIFLDSLFFRLIHIHVLSAQPSLYLQSALYFEPDSAVAKDAYLKVKETGSPYLEWVIGRPAEKPPLLATLTGHEPQVCTWGLGD